MNKIKPKSFQKGTKVKAMRTTATGTVVSGKPFVVRYNLRGKTFVRFSSPKYWKKTK